MIKQIEKRISVKYNPKIIESETLKYDGMTNNIENNICCSTYYYKKNDNLPNEIKDKIDDFKVGTKTYWKHKFKSVINELNKCVDCWCDEQLEFRYCKGRHIPIYNECKNEFKSLNDYEEHLHINLKSNVILDIINDNYDIFEEWRN